jgi:glycosyltransferase involved in cell wall biosynthesis
MIERVLQGICDNSSSLVKECIIVLDGCTDRSEELVLKFLVTKRKIHFRIYSAPDVWEIKSCNIGYKAATQPFIINFQDDMVVTELGYDVRLLKPALVWPDVFAVTALAACDLTIVNEHLTFCDIHNEHNFPRNMFAIRDTVNRGPLLLRHSMLEDLNYLDEIYAPQGMDDIDICLRAWEKYEWVSGLYCMPAFFKTEDGTTRNNANSAKVTQLAWYKNDPILIGRHRDTIMGPKHSENRLLE